MSFYPFSCQEKQGEFECLQDPPHRLHNNTPQLDVSLLILSVHVGNHVVPQSKEGPHQTQLLVESLHAGALALQLK